MQGLDRAPLTNPTLGNQQSRGWFGYRPHWLVSLKQNYPELETDSRLLSCNVLTCKSSNGSGLAPRTRIRTRTRGTRTRRTRTKKNENKKDENKKQDRKYGTHETTRSTLSYGKPPMNVIPHHMSQEGREWGDADRGTCIWPRRQTGTIGHGLTQAIASTMIDLGRSKWLRNCRNSGQPGYFC